MDTLPALPSASRRLQLDLLRVKIEQVMSGPRLGPASDVISMCIFLFKPGVMGINSKV